MRNELNGSLNLRHHGRIGPNEVAGLFLQFGLLGSRKALFVAVELGDAEDRGANLVAGFLGGHQASEGDEVAFFVLRVPSVAGFPGGPLSFGRDTIVDDGQELVRVILECGQGGFNVRERRGRSVDLVQGHVAEGVQGEHRLLNGLLNYCC